MLLEAFDAEREKSEATGAEQERVATEDRQELDRTENEQQRVTSEVEESEKLKTNQKPETLV